MRSELVIAGVYGEYDEERIAGREVWTVGRSPYEGASRYYELHGLSFPCFPGREYTRSVCPALEADMTVPLGNSVCAMLMEAVYEGYTDIEILNCPLCASQEYIRERMDLAYCIAVARERFGSRVSWDVLDTEMKSRYGSLARGAS